jgi:ABC-2 type transport system permease protein
MSRVMVVAGKEVRQLIKSRNVMLSAIIFVVVFGIFTGPAVVAGTAGPGQVMDTLGFYLVLTLGIFMGYLFTAQVFLREKQEGVIETLLCAPLSLRELWLGKVLGVTIPAAVLTYLSAVLIMIGGSVFTGYTLIPSIPVLFHIIIVVPVFIAAASGLMGFVQFILGMRENQILNFVIIFGIIFLITFTRELIGPGFSVTWVVVGAAFGLALLIILVTSWLTRFLSRERIVTTLPE